MDLKGLSYSCTRVRLTGNDEFYTYYEDIADELECHLEHNLDMFKDKVIYCPCDDFTKSNFPKYFMDNRARLKFKKLICSCYRKSSLLSKNNGQLWIVNADGDIKTSLLDGSGDFRFNELSQYFDEADFIITNPPFSLSTELYELIEKYKCHFIVVGTVLQLHTRILLNRLRRHTLWGGIQ